MCLGDSQVFVLLVPFLENFPAEGNSSFSGCEFSRIMRFTRANPVLQFCSFVGFRPSWVGSFAQRKRFGCFSQELVLVSLSIIVFSSARANFIPSGVRSTIRLFLPLHPSRMPLVRRFMESSLTRLTFQYFLVRNSLSHLILPWEFHILMRNSPSRHTGQNPVFTTLFPVFPLFLSQRRNTPFSAEYFPPSQN